MPDRTDAVRAAVAEQAPGFGFEFVPVRVESAFDPSWWAEIVGAGDDESGVTRGIGVDISSEGEACSPVTLSTHTHRRLPNAFKTDLPLLPLPSSFTSTSTSTSTPRARLQRYLAALPTPTAARASLSALVRSVLLHTAARLRCTHLALGTPLTALSVSLLSYVGHGAGAHLPEAFGEVWDGRGPRAEAAEEARQGEEEEEQGEQREKGEKGGPRGGRPPRVNVRVVRPLQDIGAKECAAYVRWRHLPIVPAPTHALPEFGGKATISGLATDFVVGLERDYPSTVSAIVRTCAKLKSKEEGEGRCVLCER